MMTGELELSKVIEQTGKYHPLFVDTYIVFTAFLLLVTVVLMNLLGNVNLLIIISIYINIK